VGEKAYVLFRSSRCWLGSGRVRRWQVVAVPVLILTLVLIGIIVFKRISPVTDSHSQIPQVGAFNYAWYDPSSTVSWEYPKIQDRPVLGYYNSCDRAVINQHFAWLTDLNIDFVVVSWWGIDNQYVWRGTFINNMVQQVLHAAEEDGANVKVAIMVEPFNESGTYNLDEIYNYIYGIVEQHRTVYFKVDGTP
jgi:hypothetical protein